MDGAIVLHRLAIFATAFVGTFVFMLLVYQLLRIRSRLQAKQGRMGGRSGRIGDIGPPDTGDVLRDADKRVAYGYYEDAATIVLDHMSRNTKSMPLIGKLLEIYFIWGNREKFDNASEQFASTLKAEGEWHKVETMRKAFSELTTTKEAGA